MKITSFLKKNLLYLDGGMGTLLQAAGLAPGELPERWNLTDADKITAIHRAYFEAGSHVVNTNTFGANVLKFGEAELEGIVAAAIDNARRAAREANAAHPKWVALDIGPTGRMLKPYGDLDFEEAVEIFAKTVRLGVKYGADLIFIETMADSYETKAAVLAAKENSTLPVFVSNAYGADGKLMTGADPLAMITMLEGLGADAIGVNCSLGPKALGEVVKTYLKYATVPVLFKPNAGLPQVVNGKTVYDLGADEFADEVADFVGQGASAVGGCCGTTPAYIAAICQKTANTVPVRRDVRPVTAVSSYTHAVVFDKEPILIGERINPTGKKRFKEALRAGDMDYILREGLAQEEKGVHILDVNVGLPEIDEASMLTDTVCALQAVTDLPLQIDTSDFEAMARALRRYNGKAMLNSVNGKRESMETVLPLAKKYGALVVALTLDEQGIPSSAKARVAIAKRILACAKKYGIRKQDIIFDPLALTVSADQNAAVETLKAVHEIRYGLGCHTSLGVSNVSFGLPCREAITSSFFTLALGQGLSAAIMNPYAGDMMRAYYAYRALSGLDNNCADYIDFAATLPVSAAAPAAVTPIVTQTAGIADTLQHAVVKGLADRAAVLAQELLKVKAPLAVVQEEILPALDIVGVGFENKTVYLPQLLMAAEAAKAAFECVRTKMQVGESATKCPVVIATVRGDIHDIGKNIVKLLLENYGFCVTDLGRDVPPVRVLEEVVRLHAPIAALSALMTTTVPAMEKTVALLKKNAPWCRVMVGGAVLTPEYAKNIGADYYAADAMGAVRCAEEIFANLS
ncbi:MAG: homocysteine methyltransferase [Ruminococcaceae bacterium]|nr:homocysteine methyltransferase [Oscillospiraceae bacterium]